MLFLANSFVTNTRPVIMLFITVVTVIAMNTPLCSAASTSTEAKMKPFLDFVYAINDKTSYRVAEIGSSNAADAVIRKTDFGLWIAGKHKDTKRQVVFKV